MGKRARVTARGESKGAKLRKIGEEVQFNLLKLSAMDTAMDAIFHNIRHTTTDLMGRVARDETTLRQAMTKLTPDACMDIVKDITSTSKYENRVESFMTLLFSKEVESVCVYEAKCRVARALLKEATECALTACYASDNGLIDWTRLQEDLLKRIRGEATADVHM